MKRSGVRTRTLGIGWEERFLEAVRKARERSLIPADQAEKLRRLAGAYFCVKCKQEHRTESRLGKAHLRLQPKPAEEPAAPKKGKAATLPEELASKAKAAGKPARAVLAKADTRPPKQAKKKRA